MQLAAAIHGRREAREIGVSRSIRNYETRDSSLVGIECDAS
jgi:hypothetical protein